MPIAVHAAAVAAELVDSLVGDRVKLGGGSGGVNVGDDGVGEGEPTCARTD